MTIDLLCIIFVFFCFNFIMDENIIGTPIIKIKICSKLIATGHGIAPKVSSFDMNIKQWNPNIFDGDISLSKTCKKR